MKVFQALRDALLYLTEGVGRIFSPSKDEYPETGVQPFDGEPYSQWVDLSKR